MKNTSMKTNRRPERGPITHANTEEREKNTASRLSRFGLEVACSRFACLCLVEAVRIECECVHVIFIFICLISILSWLLINSHFVLIVVVRMDCIVGPAALCGVDL